MKLRLPIIFCFCLLGCATFRSSPPLPTANSVERDQLVVYSDFKLARHHRLLDELAAQRGDLTDKLQLPSTSDEPIHVYLFQTPKRYQAFIGDKYPDFPDRRAFFVETDTQLTVYAHWGDRVAEDLRHEVSHAYLHSVLPNLPLWLDEGLAEYFEVPRGHRGFNEPHLALLLRDYRRDRWTPNLRRLEKLVAAEELTQRDYAESWAWMHMMLESSPQRLDTLRNHLARIRMTGSAGPLSAAIAEIESEPERALLQHLKSLDGA